MVKVGCRMRLLIEPRPQVDDSQVDDLLCMVAGNTSVPGPGFVTYW
jgi:hypothetical protein